MPAATQNLVIEQGASFSLAFAVKHADGTAFDLTGWTATSQIRRQVDDLDVVVSFTTTISAPATGVIVMGLSPQQTANLDFDNAVYDLKISNALSAIRLLKGTVTLDKQVTR